MRTRPVCQGRDRTAAPSEHRQTVGVSGSGARRLVGVDAARGLALLGMMSVHVIPARDDGGTTAAHLLAAGRSAALFAVLAGVGVALLTGGTRPVTGERRTRLSIALVVRGVLVGLLGLLLGSLASGVAVILAYYALLFVLAVPLLRLPPRALLPLGAAVAVVVPVVSQALRPALGDPLRTSPTIGTLLSEPGRLLETLLVTGYYPVLAWTAYLCVGLAVGRLALDSRRIAALLLAGGTALAVAASVVSAALLGPLGGLDRIAEATDLRGLDPADAVAEGRFGTVPTTTWWWLATDAPHSTTPLDLLHTTGTALAVLGAACLLVPVAGRLLTPLAAAGSMPLTLYSWHLVVLATVGRDVPAVPFWAAQAVGALVVATVYRQQFGRGPLEAGLAATTRRLAVRS
jgi:uncharacterized membrane protein